MCEASREKELAAQQPDAAYAAPQFPDHPEPMVMDWSAIEISAIAQYGRDMYEAGKRASHGQAPAGATLRSMIEGMSVSVDVSTGDHDAGHRYFGTVTEVMECQGDKHGVTLLVQDAEPNFTATPTAPSTPSPTAPADSVQEDTARLDWLEQNLFHREKDEWDTKFGGYKEYNMWVLFSPKGIQGRARDIIDAARKQGATP